MTNHFKCYWLPVIIWAIVIFTVSSLSTFPKQVEQLLSFDELAHAAEYAIFGFLLARAFANSKKENLKNNFRFFAIICAIIYGISDELHQYFIPLRTMSIIDLIYDCIGAAVGQIFYKNK